MSTRKAAIADDSPSWQVTVYGLGIQTNVALPELIPGAAVIDVVIRLAALPPRPHDHKDDIYYARATDREAYLSWRHVGAFLVRDGREILVDPECEERVLRSYLLGPVLGVVLRQRGRLVMHASGIDIRGRVAAFIGDAGQGKSTIAAALYERGYPLITDDLLAFHPINGTGAPMVAPGFPTLKLRPDALTAFGMHPDTLRSSHPLEEKYLHGASRGFSLCARPLGSICVLTRGPEGGLEPLGAQASIAALLRHTSSPRPELVSVDDVPARLRQCADIINRVPIYRLTVPRSFEGLPGVVSLIESRMKG